jgi:small redox-active disulfide protein 2
LEYKVKIKYGGIMNIKILGTGCPKCKKLENNAKKAIDGLTGEYTIEKVSDLNKIIDYGVMMTPALVIDEEVISTGKVCSVDEIQKFLSK